MKRKITTYLLLACCLTGFALRAQQKTKGLGSDHLKEIGLPYIQNYKAKTYGASTQNWAGLQVENGLVYFGNSEGVLEYDGVSWRLIQLPNKGIVRSLGKN